MKHNQLSSNNRIVNCRNCGVKTHSSIDGNIDIQLCRQCLDAAGLENEHSDGHHKDKPNADCVDCQAERAIYGFEPILGEAPGTKPVLEFSTESELSPESLEKKLSAAFTTTLSTEETALAHYRLDLESPEWQCFIDARRLCYALNQVERLAGDAYGWADKASYDIAKVMGWPADYLYNCFCDNELGSPGTQKSMIDRIVSEYLDDQLASERNQVLSSTESEVMGTIEKLLGAAPPSGVAEHDSKAADGTFYRIRVTRHTDNYATVIVIVATTDRVGYESYEPLVQWDGPAGEYGCWEKLAFWLVEHGGYEAHGLPSGPFADMSQAQGELYEKNRA